ncbi:MAG: stage V sporulation protein AD [Clostridia bacterium]|nr:stage V sporulation protein AD [Clostridia bacterium]
MLIGGNMQKRIVKLKNACIASAASAVGRHEALGPMGDRFDYKDTTDRFGADTWEQAESAMQKRAFETLMKKSGLDVGDFGAMFAGDLQNQCVGSSYGLVEFDVPYFGLYGACSTAAEGLMLAAMCVAAGHYDRVAAVTSSHYLAAERQYRSPIEYGAQRSPTAQWTVTGAAAFSVEPRGLAEITEAMPGIVVEKGITDASNMGAAMAPAVVDTLVNYFRESGCSPEDIGQIVTGDLGFEGGSILCEMMLAEGFDIRKNYNDCGMLIYDRERQDKHAGGSGCGCSAVVLASYYLEKLRMGELKSMLFVGTGAMMSPSSIQQGLAIPAVAHLLKIESREA